MLERIKPINDLVNATLDRLPEAIWISDSTTFFDSAIGGGQFVSAIERRLRDYGHSDKNISQRVFGHEYTQALVDLAVNMYNLVGQYTKMSYDDLFKTNKKPEYDVVVGNPPYQDNRAPTVKLWPRFVESGFANLVNNGYMIYVTPRSWVERPQSQLSNRIVNRIFKENQLVWIDITAKQHFPNVGENPCAYCIKKNKKTDLTELILQDSTSWIDYTGQKIPLDILDKYKVAIFPKIHDKGHGYLSKLTYSDTGTADSVDLMLKKQTLLNKPTKTSLEVYWTAANVDKFFMEKTKVKPGIKVIINRSGYYYKPDMPDKYILIDHSGKYAVGAGAFGITCTDIDQAKNLVSLLTTKLYRWFIDNEKTSGFNTGITKLPLLDLNKAWTDAEVFKLFNITADERKFIKKFYE